MTHCEQTPKASRPQRQTHLSRDHNGFMEGLLIAVQPFHILQKACAVMKHLPPIITLIDVFIVAITAVTAAGCCTGSICLGARGQSSSSSSSSSAFLGCLESDGGSIVQEGKLTQARCNGVWVKGCPAQVCVLLNLQYCTGRLLYSMCLTYRLHCRHMWYSKQAGTLASWLHCNWQTMSGISMTALLKIS